MLAKKNVNIATMQVYRSAKGQQAVMVVECDQLIPEDGIVWLAGVEGVQKVTYFPDLRRKQITDNENGVQVYDSRISYTERIAGTGSFTES